VLTALTKETGGVDDPNIEGPEPSVGPLIDYSRFAFLDAAVDECVQAWAGDYGDLDPDRRVGDDRSAVLGGVGCDVGGECGVVVCEGGVDAEW
jgi:hypothetical protein